MMETVLLAFMLIAAVCIGAATYNLMKLSSLPARERYKVLRFKGDSLTIGYGLFAHTYKLNDYGHIVWITNEHIIDLSTDLLMKELRQHGVQCFKERNWCS